MKNIAEIIDLLSKKTVSQCVIITDHIVKKRYGLLLQNSLEKAGYKTLLYSFLSSEKNKNTITKEKIEKAMFSHRCDRNALILALGGGIVGDVAGFVAATYLRGIAYVQIPTTLLAMVDSSIGGKTGVNTAYGKNTIGCIYHPIAIVSDVTFLKTLPKKQVLNGLIEAIKVFLTHDIKSLLYVERYLEKIIQGEEKYLKSIINRAIRIKKDIVSRDEHDKNERLLLNFGHTIGHALEKLSDYTISHGMAVGYGILAESAISVNLGLLDIEKYYFIKNLFFRLGIDTDHFKKWDIEQLIQCTKNDKKNKEQAVHYVLLKDLGWAYVKNNKYTQAVGDHVIEGVFFN